MKKIIGNALLVLIFLLGLGLICYPSLSNWYNEQVGSYSIQTYQEVVDNTPYEEYASIFSDARTYNETLSPTEPEYVSGVATDETYRNTLNLVDGMMGTLIIDKIDVNLPIYHGTDEGVLQTAIGHLEGSALPTGSLGEHSAFTGHTGLPSATLLTNLTKLAIGDTFVVQVLNEVYTYEVFETLVVEPQEVEALLPMADKNLVTLITCTPYGINSHRLFVQGQLISTEVITPDLTNESTPHTDATTTQSKMPAWLLGAAMVVAKNTAEFVRTFSDGLSAALVTWQNAGAYKWIIFGGCILAVCAWVFYMLFVPSNPPKHYPPSKFAKKQAQNKMATAKETTPKKASITPKAFFSKLWQKPKHYASRGKK